MTEHEHEPEDRLEDPPLVPQEVERLRQQQLEMSLLRALYEKGPALPIELAVRTFSFPDEITEPLHSLEEDGYITRQRMRKGEIYILTKSGYARAVEGSRKEAP